MSDTKVVYCVNDSRTFRAQLINSLKSLNRFMEPEDIIVIVNPPSKSKSITHLNGKLCTIYDGDGFYESLQLPNYKYKIELCEIDCDNLIFLDTDTIIMKDITELIDGNYDFSAKEEPCRAYKGIKKPTWNDSFWKGTLKELGKPEYSIPYNDGFMIFKHRLHMKIHNDWIMYYKYYHNKVWNSPNTVDDMHHNEFALSLAVAGYKIKPMDNEHWFGWRGQRYQHKDDIYVVHVGTNKRGLSGYMDNLRIIFPEGLKND